MQHTLQICVSCSKCTMQRSFLLVCVSNSIVYVSLPLHFCRAGIIQDSFVNASSYRENNEPSKARGNRPGGWIPLSNDSKPWIQVSLNLELVIFSFPIILWSKVNII